MGFFDEEKNVQKYIQMAEGTSGSFLIQQLQDFLQPKKRLLELGMGPGKDLEILSEIYSVTGSDSSKIFLQKFQDQNPDIPALHVDAVRIQTDQKFDCIYSNKVLQHLSRSELIRSIKRQKEILNPQGLVLHSFWRGEGNESFDGLFFQYYQAEELRTLFEKEFEILEILLYEEMEAEDSICLIAKILN